MWFTLKHILVGGAAAFALTAHGHNMALASSPALPPAYGQHCAGCHGPSLGGSFGPPVRGRAFVAKWSAKGVAALRTYIASNMPPGGTDAISAADYDSISSAIWAANGMTATGAASSAAKVQAPARKSVSQATAEGGLVAPKENHDAAYTAAMAARAQRLNSLPDVDDMALRTPGDGQWLQSRRTQDGFGYSPLRQVNEGNVGDLELAWSLSLPGGTNGIEPLAHDGVIFVNSAGIVQAIDVISGDVLWRFERKAEVAPLGPPVSQPRGLAIAGKLLFVPTMDNHIIALDMRTGTVVWDRHIEEARITLRITAAPIVVRDKLLVGMSGCAGGQETGGCFITALSARDGTPLWRFYTLPRVGEPGFETWGGSDPRERFGGSVWSSASYDPELNLAYFGVGQTYHIAPLLRKPKAGTTNNGLYTDSTLAIDPDTGKLKWYYQHLARDIWDVDWSFERQIVPAGNGAGKQVVTVGKLGIMDSVDAATGQYRASVDLGFQNIVTGIDAKTGEKTTDPAYELELGVTRHPCPFAGGVRNWPATSFDPDRRLLFVPFTRSCMSIIFNGEEGYDIAYGIEPPPPGDDRIGGVAAIDIDKNQVAWMARQRMPAASGVLATAGGVVFAGDRDRWLRAWSSGTGALLWQTRLDRSLSANPISFSSDGSATGTQYVAITSGGGAPNDVTQPPLAPEMSPTGPGVTLWVFKLRNRTQ